MTPPPPVAGRLEPRIATLNYTGQTLGDELLEFAVNVLGETPDPWHVWLARHALETLPDGTFRFRTILLLVARQNGKSWFLRVLVLWLMFTGRARFVLWTSQSLSISGNMHRELAETIRATPALNKRCRSITQRYEEKTIVLTDGTMFRIVANTEDAARSLSVDCLIVDELRTFKKWEGWNALVATTAAKPNALIVCASNAGDDESVVLNTFQSAARANIHDPDTDTFLGEWSAPDGASIRDVEAIAYANPALGHGRTTMRAITAARANMPEAGFRTEYLCQRVAHLDSAVPEWVNRSDNGLSLAGLKIAAGFDVALDATHASLVFAAYLPDGRIGVAPAAAWETAHAASKALGDLGARYLWQALGWGASGPASVVGTALARQRNPRPMSPADVQAACMAFAELSAAGQIVHGNDPLLNDHVTAAGKAWSGDRWSFTRRGTGHVDAAYACAIAVRALETQPIASVEWEGSLIL